MQGSDHQADGLIVQSTQSPAPAFTLPSPYAWVAQCCVDGGLQEVEPSKAVLAIFTISVHEQVPVSLRARADVALRVLKQWGPTVPTGLESLWVLPAGFLGYDPIANDWMGCKPEETWATVKPIVRALPARATLVMGVDPSRGMQQAWILRPDTTLATAQIITRGQTEIASRVVDLGTLKGSVFVCGELLGSGQQGPIAPGKYMGDPATRLSDVQVLIDVAHRRVPKGWGQNTNPRWAHDSRFRRFASKGIAVLAHHHDGSGRFNCQSNWICLPFPAPHYVPKTSPIG